MIERAQLRKEHRPHEERCIEDDQMWPCSTICLLDEVERLSAALVEWGEQAQACIDERDPNERLAMAWDVLHSMVETAALNSSTGQQNAPVVPEEFGNEGDAP